MVIYRALPFVLAVCVISETTARCDEPARQAAERLLTTLWDKQSNRTVEIPEVFRKSVQELGQHPLLLQAYVLNRMHYYRYRDALPVAEQLSDLSPDLLEAWMMRAWIQGILSRFERMLIEIQLAAQRLGPAIQSGQYEQVELERIAARLGRMYGFAEGPAQHDVNAATLRDVLREIQRALNDDLLRIFEDERQDVLAQYVRAANDRQQSLIQSEQDWQTKSQQEIQNLDAANAQLQQRRDQLQQEAIRVRDDGRRQLSEFDSRLEPLRGEALAANRRLASVEWSWQIVAQNIAAEEALLAREQDPHLRAIILARISQLQWQLRGIETDLFGLRAHLATLRQQLNALELQRRSLAQSLDAQLSTLQGELQQVQRSERQNLTRRDKLLGSTAPVPTSARVISDQIKVLATYDPYPVEAERQRLLQDLRQLARGGG